MPDSPPHIGFRRDLIPEISANTQNVSLSYSPSDFPPQPMPISSTSSTIEVTFDSSSSSSSSSDEDEVVVVGYKMRKLNSILYENGCAWQFCNGSGPFPEKMVRAGVDSDGSPIFAGRAFHEGDMIPAKVIPSKNIAYICWGGDEHPKEDFEVLRSGEFVWEFATSGEIPEGAVPMGTTSDGEQLYMGRAMHQGTQTPGKLQPSHGCLYIPFDGSEVAITEYEVLCLK